MKFGQTARTAATLVLLSLLAACASQQNKEEAAGSPAGAGTAAASSGSQQQPGASAATPSRSVAGSGLNDPKNTLYKRSVYYDYDQYGIKHDYHSIVEAHARYLKEHPGANVTVEGNCDERGSREYNLALGQRRADGVKSMLTVMGVPERQVETVSFGEEKPRAEGHAEESWSQNRRSDIVYRRIE